MTIHHDLRHDHDTDPCYCARCCTAVTPRTRICPGCDLDFSGAGHYQRLPGTPPSSDFGFLFGRADAERREAA